MANTDLTTRTVQPVYVQTAKSVQPNDDGWVNRSRLRYVGGSEGQGQVLGDARFEQVFGVVKEEAETDFSSVGVSPNVDHGTTSAPLAGQYVRLLLGDGLGSTIIDGLRCTPFWWGVMLNPGERSDGASDTKLGGSADWDALDIRYVLGQIRIREGFELASDGTTVIDPGYMPKFNGYPTGDRSAAQVTVNGRPAYVFNRFAAADPTIIPTSAKWNAAQVVDLLLKGCGKPTLPEIGAGIGLAWALFNVNEPALQFTPHELDLDGLSILDAINTIINMRRGLTWYAEVVGDVAYVKVTSTVKTAIVTPTFTLPAAATQTAVDWRGDVFLEDMTIARDYSNVFDVVELRGSRPWVGMTWWYDLGGISTPVRTSGWSAMTKGWTADEEAAYNAGGYVDPISGVKYSNEEKVWRYFRPRNEYIGQQYSAATTGIRNKLTTKGKADAPDALYGVGGYDGTRTYDAATNAIMPPAWTLELTRDLPCGKHFNSAPLGPRQEPVFIVGSGTSWQDLTLVNQIQVDSKPPAVMFGAEQPLAQIAGTVLLFTVGLREPQPLRVSWQRAQADWPRDTPRVKVITIPEWEQWVTLPGTVIAVRVDGSLQTLPSIVTSRDDVTSMQSMLGLLLPFFSAPGVLPSWRDRGILDISSAKRASALITTVTKGDGAVDCNATITRRQWVFVPEQGEIGSPGYMPAHFDTLYISGRPVPEVESFR